MSPFALRRPAEAVSKRRWRTVLGSRHGVPHHERFQIRRKAL
jgi:hypothetical protein